MKPTKNKFHCPACQHTKMLFATKEEAIRFLKYNADDIEHETGKRPVRTYYCTACGGWHITSKPQSSDYHSLVKDMVRLTERKYLMKCQLSRGVGMELKRDCVVK